MLGGSDDVNGTVVRQALLSGAIVGVILFTVVGAIWLTYVMGGAGSNPFMVSPAPNAATATPAPVIASASATATSLPPTPTSVAPSSTSRPAAPATATQTAAPAFTVTSTPTTECPRPATWQPYLVQPSDDLFSLAFRYFVTEAQIREGNCMAAEARLVVGAYINLPGALLTPTPTSCVRPSDWLPYVLRSGDQIDQLALVYGITAATLLANSCLPPDYSPAAGETVYLPPAVGYSTPTYNGWPTPTYRTPTPYYPWPTPATWPTPVPWPTPVHWTPTPRPTQAWPTSAPATPQPTIPPLSTPTRGAPVPTQAWPTPVPTRPPVPTPVPTQPRPTPIPPQPTPVPPRPTPIPPQPTIPPLSTPTRPAK